MGHFGISFRIMLLGVFFDTGITASASSIPLANGISTSQTVRDKYLSQSKYRWEIKAKWDWETEIKWLAHSLGARQWQSWESSSWARIPAGQCSLLVGKTGGTKNIERGEQWFWERQLAWWSTCDQRNSV